MMKKMIAIAMAAALAAAPVCMAEERGDLIIDRDDDGVEDIGYRAAVNEDFVGDWQDQTTQRAEMTVTEEDGVLMFTVSWASSADENTVWQFSGVPADDGVVDYADGVITNYTYGEDSTEEAEVVSEGTSGCVAIDDDGMIYWVDSETPDSNTMRFEHVV